MFKNAVGVKKVLKLTTEVVIITSTEPNTPLNDADHVGSFFCLEGFTNKQLTKLPIGSITLPKGRTQPWTERARSSRR